MAKKRVTKKKAKTVSKKKCCLFEKNEGKLDRVLRTILAILLFVWARTLIGTWQIVFGIISLILIITAITGFCALYKIFRINTNKK